MNRFSITILEDGTIKADSGAFGPTVHATAEAFLREVSRLAGGPTTRQRKGVHTHGAHGHSHSHGSEVHQH